MIASLCGLVRASPVRALPDFDSPRGKTTRRPQRDTREVRCEVREVREVRESRGLQGK